MSGLSKDEIIDRYVLAFDAHDKSNGSLYVGVERQGGSLALLKRVIAGLREASLWSDHEASHVADEQRPAYKAQLELRSVVSFSSDEGRFLIARFEHPKYPSDDQRWRRWQDHLAQHHSEHA